MIRTVLALFFSVSCSFGQTVFNTDFDGSLPTEVNPGSATLTGVQGFAGLGYPGNQFGGNFLRSPTGNVAKLQLTGLPPHTTVNIGFLLAAIR